MMHILFSLSLLNIHLNTTLACVDDTTIVSLMNAYRQFISSDVGQGLN